MSCKFKPGEEYRTRDGRRARVYAVDGGGKFPIHGAIYYGDEWWVERWTKIGRYSITAETEDDIISPRQKIVRWVNIYPDFELMHLNKKDADTKAGDDRIACKRVEIEYCEGEFDS